MAKKLNNGYDSHPVDAKDKLLQEPRTIKGSTKKKTSPNVKGCPENDNKEHVYAHVKTIVTQPNGASWDMHSWGPCIGCGQTKSIRKWKDRPTGEPDVIERRVSQWNSWARIKGGL